jgi:tRNA threonylcarbamoyl adenosine modification protein YeaZ
VIALLEHSEPSAHAERILPLIERCLVEAGWDRSSLERIAVGVGPGSFVGLRVGVALAQGLGLGLGVPVVGVGSLRSLAAAVPMKRSGARIALLDARRDELFAAVYAADGTELIAPHTVPLLEARAFVDSVGADAVVVGSIARSLHLAVDCVWAGDRDFPSADRTALLARHANPDEAPPLPQYCRGPGATLPVLPPSPFGTEP